MLVTLVADPARERSSCMLWLVSCADSGVVLVVGAVCGRSRQNVAVKFRAELQLHGKTATFFEVPGDVVAKLDAGKRPKVVVKVAKHTCRSSMAPMDGCFLLPLNAGNRAAAGLKAGDTVELDVTVDAAPRVVELPVDVAKLLGGARSVPHKHFDSLSFTHQREWVEWIESAKRT